METDWTRSALSFIQYSYFLPWCAHVNTVLQSCLYIIEDIEVADELALQITQI